jgi:segregation and condensation protein A
MSAVLIEIKSRMLLPKKIAEVDSERDPRAELVRKLMEYELIKIASERLTQMPQVGVDLYVANAYFEKITEITYPDVSIDEIFAAWKNILNRAKHFDAHKVMRNELSVREHMTIILRKLQEEEFIEFSSLFNVAEDRIQKIVVCFLAILELARERLIKITQQESFSPIYIKLQIN